MAGTQLYSVFRLIMTKDKEKSEENQSLFQLQVFLTLYNYSSFV